MGPYGPDAQAGLGIAPNEHFPNKEAAVLTGHEGPVLVVRFNSQGTYCLSGGKDRTIQLWNPHRGVRIKSYAGHGYEVRDVAVSQDNSRFASCGGDRQVFLWDVSTGNVIRKFRGHDGAVNAVRYSPNFDILVSGGYDQAVKVWDCRSRSIDPVQIMKSFADSVTSVMVSERSDILAGSVDGTIRRFDVRMGRIVTDLLHHPITSIAATKDGECILAACTDSCVRLIDRADGDLLGEYRGHKHSSAKLDAAFTPSDGYVIACSEDGRVLYWEIVEGSLVEEFKAHEDVVCSLAMHPKGECLVTASVDAKLYKTNAVRARSLGSESGLARESSGDDIYVAKGESGRQSPQTMRYYRESRMDTLARYRGVLTVVAIPVLLFIAFLMLSPGKPEHASSFNRSQPFSRVEYEGAGRADKNERWAVVIDAGSTGSRVHIFKFLTDASGNLELQFDKFDQLKPGLSSFADDPAGAAMSLKPLIDLAVATVPSSLQSSTPIMVGATAGLRLLPDGKADIILDEVRHYLRSFPFKFQDDDVKILSGVDEGAFAWLTLNYLLGHLGKPHTETVAAIDLGGGSVQEAFAMSKDEAKSAPKADYVTHLRGGGQEYSVYVYSYLGYGLMAGRAAVLQEDPNGPEDDTHPCIHGGHSGEYEYGGKSFVAVGHDDGASHGECAVTVQNALKPQEKCGAPQKQCSFSGAWAGPRIPAVFYVSSYFWDRAADAGLVHDDKHISAKVQPGHFETAALEACPLHVDSLEESFPRVQESHRPFFCLDLTYAYTLLTHGFKIPKNKEITLVKKVEYKGETVEAAWPLGAAINLLN